MVTITSGMGGFEHFYEMAIDIFKCFIVNENVPISIKCDSSLFLKDYGIG